MKPIDPVGSPPLLLSRPPGAADGDDADDDGASHDASEHDTVQLLVRRQRRARAHLHDEAQEVDEQQRGRHREIDLIV